MSGISLSTAGPTINLQTFFLDFLATAGAVTEVTGYALAEALLPADLAASLGMPEILALAFDHEVARENPDAEFVTFGSQLLDRVAQQGLAAGRLTRKYASAGPLAVPTGLVERVEKRLAFVRCRRPTLRTAALVQAETLCFQFLVHFVSDEKQEKVYNIWVDAVTGLPAAGNGVALQAVFFSPADSEVTELPAAPHCGYEEAYRTAREVLPVSMAQDRQSFQERMTAFLREEAGQLHGYYSATMAELVKRRDRLAPGEAGRERFEQKLAASEADFRKRLEDVRQKYRILLEARLDSLIVYVLPKVRLTVEVRHKASTVILNLYYNLATSELELPYCPVCRRPFAVVHIARDSTPVCPECAGAG